jgi:hypothetical protein
MALRLLRNSYLLSKLENLYIKDIAMKRSFFILLFVSFSLQASTTDSIWLSDIKSITFKTYPTSASVSIVKDSVQYTFTIPKSSFSIHDTLTGTLSAFNQSSKVDTIAVGPSFFGWMLKNSDGQIILKGPLIVSAIVFDVYLNPKQSVPLYQLDGSNVYPNGGTVVPGYYTLNANLGSMIFTLNISFY